MKKRPQIKYLLIALCLFFSPACAMRQGGSTLTLAHINDTHGHVAPEAFSFRLDNETIRTEAAGFPRLAALLKKSRSRDRELLFVHAGDAFQGTLFFKRFAGRADCNLLNALGLDAMAVGNHEFDRGPKALADFAAQARFPLLAANVDASREPSLRGLIRPYSIKMVHGLKIGIIGLITPETPQISQPGDNLVFYDPEASAKKAIIELTARGVHAIIILSHLGYERDLALAACLPEIDIIAGGHSHTLLGDFSPLGLASDGPYPAVRKNADNATVLVVQAWESAKIAGLLKVSFDRSGEIIAWSGEPLMPVGTCFFKDGKAAGSRREVAKIRDELGGNLVPLDEDPDARKLLEPYEREVQALYKQKLAQAPADIEHVRVPGPQHPAGSELAPLVAESMLWKMRAAGKKADAAITNAGHVRGSLAAGDVTVGRLAELLPFDDTLVLCRLRGRDLRQVLEQAVGRAVEASGSGSFPYTAGLRFTANFSLPPGRRVLKIELQDSRGRWRPLRNDSRYRVVVNSYIAKGRGGYSALAQTSADVLDTGYRDLETFLEYAAGQSQLTRPPRANITVVGWKK